MTIKFVIVFVLVLVIPINVLAQLNITDDQVNAIAKKMYCPVCENVPLDSCGTAACDDWRSEIRVMLAQGMTEEQIRTDFVDRFGDRVVGTPANPVLRALSLITPWVLAAVALGVALRTFVYWGRRNASTAQPVIATNESSKPDDYRAMLEQDVRGDLL